MSFFKRLFGGGGAPKAEAPAPSIEHEGFTVRATPFQEQGQWQVCGVVAREIDGVVKEHRFVRADRFTDRDVAISTTFDKARRIIVERGIRLFD